MVPKISVLMPVYNTQKYLEQSIKSILKQTFKEFELIVVDDASTDRSFKILTRLAAKDPRIKPYRLDKWLPVADVRNKLVELANTNYIAWQDSDDISTPNRLQMEYDVLLKDPEVGVVGGSMTLFDEDGIISTRSYPLKDKDIRKVVFKYSPVSQGAAMFRRDSVMNIGMYKSHMKTAEDLDLILAVGAKYKFANLPDVVLYYRRHNTSTVISKLIETELFTFKVRLDHFFKGEYRATLFDLIYNIGQITTVFIMPNQFRVKLFYFFRDKKFKFEMPFHFSLKNINFLKNKKSTQA